MFTLSCNQTYFFRQNITELNSKNIIMHNQFHTRRVTLDNFQSNDHRCYNLLVISYLLFHSYLSIFQRHSLLLATFSNSQLNSTLTHSFFNSFLIAFPILNSTQLKPTMYMLASISQLCHQFFFTTKSHTKIYICI